MNSFYTDEELKDIGFQEYGKNVLISRKASIYSPETISMGDNVRIDDFCILSGDIQLGSHIHIAAGVSLFGAGKIIIEDFSAISGKSSIYSATDNYDGSFFTSPQFPAKYRDIIIAPVIIKKHVIIGAGTTVFPGITIMEGAAVGAMSLVNRDLESWGIYAGIPARRMKDRKKDLLKLEEQFIAEYYYK